MTSSAKVTVIGITLSITAAVLACSDGTGPGGGVAKLWIEGEEWGGRNTTLQLEAFARLEDGTDLDITQDARWEMLDPDLATVDAGLITTFGQVGRSDVRITYRGVAYTDYFAVVNPVTSGAILFPDADMQVIELDAVDEPFQIVATTRLSGVPVDISDRARWSSSNPAAISVGETGVVTAHGDPAAAEIRADWRTRIGRVTVLLGDPPVKEYDVTVDPIRFFILNPCDNVSDFEDREAELTYQFNVIAPDGGRITVAGTTDYPVVDHAIDVEHPHGGTEIPGSRTLTLNDYQSFEVEVRATEWDFDVEYFSDALVRDVIATRVHRGAEFFGAGQHTLQVNENSTHCRIEFTYRVSVREL